jgi:hypothetical protein
MKDSDLINLYKVKEENLASKKNVESFFIGEKVKNGVNTGEKCLIIGVSKKEKISKLNTEDLIPKHINGLNTDVIEVPEMFAFTYCGAGEGNLPPSSVNPTGCEGHTYDEDGQPFSCVPGGISIGPKNESSSGTLGVSIKDSDGQIVGITNAHVVGPEVYIPENESEIEYIISSSDGENFDFFNATLNSLIKNPAFNDIDLPRIENERNYVFIGAAGIDSHPFFISESENIGNPARQSAFKEVTIKNSNGTIIYKTETKLTLQEEQTHIF